MNVMVKDVKDKGNKSNSSPVPKIPTSVTKEFNTKHIKKP